jgi:hypothetical protein
MVRENRKQGIGRCKNEQEKDLYYLRLHFAGGDRAGDPAEKEYR